MKVILLSIQNGIIWIFVTLTFSVPLLIFPILLLAQSSHTPGLPLGGSGVPNINIGGWSNSLVNPEYFETPYGGASLSNDLSCLV